MQRSEPEDFLKLAERMDSWALMVALIGEGQEIHIGEESGLAQWNDFVIGDAETVDVFNYPEKITDVFTKAGKLEKISR